MKYKEGDRVVVKPWKLMVEQYELIGASTIGTRVHFTGSMERLLEGTDRVVCIQSVGGEYRVAGWEDFKTISDEHILGYAFEYGDKVEASDNGKAWREETFWGYRLGHTSYPFETKETHRMFVRPIQKKVIKVRFVDEDGNDITDSLSEDSKKNLLKGKV